MEKTAKKSTNIETVHISLEAKDVKEKVTVGFLMRQKQIWKDTAHICGMGDADMLQTTVDLENTETLPSTNKQCVTNKKTKEKKNNEKIEYNVIKEERKEKITCL